ncbi:MAG: signal peptidase I [Bacillota bacterium]|nr:signal peptidase I [Bacillota bacterium]
MEQVKQKKAASREIKGWILVIAVAFTAAFLIRTFAYEPMKVPTGSMIPTIDINDWFYVNKYIYKFVPVKRGDMIVFWYPDNPTVRYVKRVIGIGGDEVVVRDGKVVVNGKLLNEPYLKEPMYTQDYGSYKVPANHYFVMGDNRNDSSDSRFWINKYVSESQIIGRPALRFWPLNRIALL